MVKLEMNLSFNDFDKAIKRLSVKDRVKLIDHLMKDDEAWRQQSRQIMRRIGVRVKKCPISQAEINRSVEEARQEIYDKRRR